ncbi:pyridoxine 5'-phosphate synthase [Nannocystis bainbridge]|uniref:Pyridoxine 5'-phosphate synthase n=1 Tax=Nannocystis bainbridge TaxID=2995303 RepID=A0ABT5DP15_9BACT|nr:pyridoxine 5'-phosphate synthase [Nannocystis bainbridge]MDC0715343.1 pyridoxine 5'-phosphate synthase [Nannocystis bainbridge]
MAARLSVNVNKVATLRNARGGDVPSLIGAVRTIVAAGAPGITVHPRADERHIRAADARAIAAELAPLRDRVEFNIEGDPRPDLLAMVEELRPHQCTLVPVRPGEITSQAGWPPDTSRAELGAIVGHLQALGVRVSLFVDADFAAVRWAAEVGAQRIELYTEPYAQAHAAGRGEAAIARFAAAAELAYELGLGVNAGHDLDLDNLPLFSHLPHLDEVSIGHALISHALFVGLDRAVRDYLGCLLQ